MQGETGQGSTRLGLRGGISVPKRGHSRGEAQGPGGGAGENPLGRHPEWLISADESLFSFRLNTLNRAPSDVYLHSLRANAGGGPRLQRPGLGVAGMLKRASSPAVGDCPSRRRVFPRPRP